YGIDYGLDCPASLSLTCARPQAAVTSKPRLSKLAAVAAPCYAPVTPSKPMILKHFRLSPRNHKIDDLYGAIVAQSRCAAFYTGYGVPDTVDGRFDLIVLHIVVLLADVGPRCWPEPIRSVLP